MNEQIDHSSKEDECASNVRNTKVSVLQDRAMSHTAKQKTSAPPHQKKNVTVTGDSMLNGTSEKGLSRAHNVKVTNFPGRTSDKIVEKLDDLIKDKPNDLVIDIGTNNLTNNVKKILNNVKKILKKVSANAPSTNLAFSSIIVRKDKRNIEKSIADTNARLKNFCMQKGIEFINNNNIKENFLGKKKLHLGQRDNSVFAKNLLKYINWKEQFNSLFNSEI